MPRISQENDDGGKYIEVDMALILASRKHNWHRPTGSLMRFIKFVIYFFYFGFCQKFGYDINKRFETQLPACEDYFSGHDLKAVLKQKLSQIYDIAQDDANIRACVKEGKVEQKAFDLLRKNYPLRREWAAHGGPQA